MELARSMQIDKMYIYTRFHIIKQTNSRSLVLQSLCHPHAMLNTLSCFDPCNSTLLNFNMMKSE